MHHIHVRHNGVIHFIGHTGECIEFTDLMHVIYEIEGRDLPDDVAKLSKRK